VPFFNFERIPVILDNPYHYGEPEPVAMADLDSGLVGAGVTDRTSQPPPTLEPRPPL